MSEDSDKFYLTIRDLINETVIRDIVIFSFLFLLVITQVWENITLLLFPLITLGFSIFFRIININKWRTKFDNPSVVYNPLGLEKRHANRLFFSALFQLILIFWLGAESLYNPHIIDRYFPYFNWLFIFLYTFGFFWIFIDLWENTKLEIIFGGNDKKPIKDHESVISYLKIKHFKLILITNLLIFLVLNIVNSILILTLDQDPLLGVQLNLPGTGSAGSDPLVVSFLLYLIFIISPATAGISLFFNNREVNLFNKKDLDNVLKPLPKDTQMVILENLKVLNNKIRNQLNIE
ncbi:MAG: hypothetical protein KGD58_03740 [Candidatus Lokiarchaeota archaeon]|nr:hypothetical protein [Candidatus Lokiarchaeota archaeon]